jgi:hypothetical protein
MQTENGSMPIVPLLAQSAFDPETIETLVSVFEAAWRKVEQSGSKLASPAYKRRPGDNREAHHRNGAARRTQSA